MSWLAFIVGYYVVGGLAINLGYHRCLTHRALKLPRLLERGFVTLGLPAGTPIQWVGTHRYHHRFADLENDPHSPHHRGFWYAHVGWYIGTSNPLVCLLYSLGGPLRTLFDAWWRPRSNQEHNALAPDVQADPYYRAISRPWPYLTACILHTFVVFGSAFLLFGLKGCWVAWLSSVVVYNVGDSIDSVAHLFGKKAGGNAGLARNNSVLGILALGEGWHANHHLFPQSARHGLFPGQFDWTWQVIKCLEIVGLAREVVVPKKDQMAGVSFC